MPLDAERVPKTKISSDRDDQRRVDDPDGEEAVDGVGVAVAGAR